MIDLHSHTYYSDGSFSPRELVEHAKDNNVTVFALTDHDTCYGDDEIEQIAKEYKIKVIKGIELSTRYNGEPIHIIGLCKGNIVSDSLREFCKDFAIKRQNRAKQMMTNIINYYHVNVNFDELYLSKSVTRKNMLDNIIKNNPNLTYEMAKEITSDQGPCYIPSSEFTPKEGLELLESFGCIKILAHPCLIKKKETLEGIISLGFDGIECYYPSMNDRENEFKELANKYGLFISGGSDCHGIDKDKNHAMIGSYGITNDEFEIIKKKLEI